MVQLRNDNPLLVYGVYTLLQPEHPEIYAYTRIMDHKKMLVLLNFTDRNSIIELQETSLINEVLINNYEPVESKDKNVSLKPDQAGICAWN